MEDGIQNRRVNRRRLLRRAGTVAAGVAGVGVAGAVVAPPASAAPGGNLILGNTSNDAASNQTSLTNSSASNPTFTVNNNGNGPQLSFNAGMTPAQVGTLPANSLLMTDEGTLWTGRPDNSPDYLRTWGNSTEVVSFAPVRLFHWGDPATHANIIDLNAFDGQGYLKANTFFSLSLDSLLLWGWTLFLNVTVVSGGGYGYLTVYPYGVPTPPTNNLIWTPGALTTNFCCTAIGSILDQSQNVIVRNVINIYAQTRAFVVVDAFAAVVNSQADVLTLGGGNSLRASAPHRVRPAGLGVKKP